MSKVKELSLVIAELRECGNRLTEVADSLADIFTAPVTEDAPATEVPKTEPVAAAPPEPEMTLVDIRRILAEKSRAGHTAEVKDLLLKHGADKLSELDPQFYVTVAKEAEGL